MRSPRCPHPPPKTYPPPPLARNGRRKKKTYAAKRPVVTKNAVEGQILDAPRIGRDRTDHSRSHRRNGWCHRLILSFSLATSRLTDMTLSSQGGLMILVVVGRCDDRALLREIPNIGSDFRYSRYSLYDTPFLYIRNLPGEINYTPVSPLRISPVKKMTTHLICFLRRWPVLRELSTKMKMMVLNSVRF